MSSRLVGSSRPLWQICSYWRFSNFRNVNKNIKGCILVTFLLILRSYSVLHITLSNTICKYPSSGRNKLSRFVLEFSLPLRASVRSFISIHQVAPFDLDLDWNTPWVNMSPFAKFGLDRPSRLAGHWQQTNRQTDITPFIMYIDRFSQFFHGYTLRGIFDTAIIKDPTSPQTRRHTTLWNTK